MFVYAVEFTKVNKGSIDIQKNLIGVQRKSEKLKATLLPSTYADVKQPHCPWNGFSTLLYQCFTEKYHRDQ